MVVPIYDRVDDCPEEVIEDYKDFVVNRKEIRIVHNVSNLRFIGNGNRILIENNAGDLLVIGNKAVLKVQRNRGKIKYIGNEGRINLGNESIQQSVDYIGCKGILKICNFSLCQKHRQPSESLNTHTAKTRDQTSSKVAKKSQTFGAYHYSLLNQKIDELPIHKKIPVKTISSDSKKNHTITIQNIGNISIKNACNIYIASHFGNVMSEIM